MNYVLRKEFDGVEATGRYGTNHYGDNWSASLLGGTSWEGFGPLGRGNVIASYEHYEQEAVLRGDLPWFRQDLQHARRRRQSRSAGHRNRRGHRQYP